jgi:hypothetical protein
MRAGRWTELVDVCGYPDITSCAAQHQAGLVGQQQHPQGSAVTGRHTTMRDISPTLQDGDEAM